jgi:hypothetical protein
MTSRAVISSAHDGEGAVVAFSAASRSDAGAVPAVWEGGVHPVDAAA